MKIDFHVHTVASHDGVNTAWEMIASAKRAGLGGLAITDHDALGWKGIRPRDFVIVPGVERSLPEGHVLVLGISELPPADSIEALLDWAEKNNAVTIPAHPYDRFRKGMGDLAFNNKFTAVEVFNGMAAGILCEKARRKASKLGLTMVSDSDAHQASEIGQHYNIVNAETAEQVLEELRKGRVEPVMKSRPLHSITAKYISRKFRNMFSRGH